MGCVVVVGMLRCGGPAFSHRPCRWRRLPAAAPQWDRHTGKRVGTATADTGGNILRSSANTGSSPLCTNIHAGVMTFTQGPVLKSRLVPRHQTHVCSASGR